MIQLLLHFCRNLICCLLSYGAFVLGYSLFGHGFFLSAFGLLLLLPAVISFIVNFLDFIVLPFGFLIEINEHGLGSAAGIISFLYCLLLSAGSVFLIVLAVMSFGLRIPFNFG